MNAARSRILFTGTPIAYNFTRTHLTSASPTLETTIATAIPSRFHRYPLKQTSHIHTTSKMSSSSNTGTSSNANTDAYNSNALDAVNQKLLAGNGPDGSKSFPSVTLPGGRTIRTGTVATLLHNISLYNVASAKAKANQEADGAKVDKAEAEALQKELSTLEHEIGLAIPALREIGMFELFTPENWLADGSGASEGRKCVGRLAKERGI